MLVSCLFSPTKMKSIAVRSFRRSQPIVGNPRPKIRSDRRRSFQMIGYAESFNIRQYGRTRLRRAFTLSSSLSSSRRTGIGDLSYTQITPTLNRKRSYFCRIWCTILCESCCFCRRRFFTQ